MSHPLLNRVRLYAPAGRPIILGWALLLGLGWSAGPVGAEPAVNDLQRLPEKLQPLAPDPNPLYLPKEVPQVEIKTTQGISLQDALELAQRTNLDLQTARQQVIAAQAGLRQAQAALFPGLGLQSQIVRNSSAAGEISGRASGTVGGGLGNSFAGAAQTTWDTALRLDYDIYTGGLRGAQIQQAEEQLVQARLNETQVAQQLQLDVANAYYDLQNADAQVTIGKSAVLNAEVSLRDAVAQERAGVGTQFAVLQAQVQLANAKQQLVNAERNQKVAQRNLVALLNLGETVNVTASDPVSVAGRWQSSLNDSILLSFNQRTELQTQLSQRRFAEAQKQQALSAIRPTIGLFAQVDFLRFLEDSGNFTEQGFGQGDQVGIQFSVTLFDGGAALAGARQADANVAIADLGFSNQRDQIRFQVETAFADLISNQANISTASLALEQANESLRLARLRFQAGVGTQTDVIQQENALTQAQGNLVDAVLGYNRALASLQRAVGNPPFQVLTSGAQAGTVAP